MNAEEINRTLDASIEIKPTAPTPLTVAQIAKRITELQSRDSGATKEEATNTAMEEIAVKPKPKFVRKPHLTERPFKEHPGLQELHRQLEKKSPRRGQRRNSKEKN